MSRRAAAPRARAIRRWRLLAADTVVDSPWFRLHRERVATGAGHILDPFWRVDAPSWVCVVATAPDGRVVLVEQYRRGCDQVVRELPAGNLEPGEDPAACAARELAEETGYRPRSPLIPLGRLYPEPARSSSCAHGFACTVGARPGRVAREPGEDMRVVMVPGARLADPAACGVVHAVHHAFLAAARGLGAQMPA